MKAFLFLYPIAEYFQRENAPSKVIKRLNELIQHRYRRRGYQVFWLLCSQEGNSKEPDRVLVDHRVKIEKNDRIICCGLPRSRTKFGNYPSPSYIVNLVSVDPCEIVVGGFHQNDCVRRIARAAHKKAYSVRVDEDTTDQLFTNWRVTGELPPLVRSPQNYANFFRNSILEACRAIGSDRLLYDKAIRLHRQERRRQPWLVPI
jgi:hypothetical protein